MKRTLTTTLLLSLALVSLAAKIPSAPNIVLILSDDQGWGATSVQMDKRIPDSASDFIRTPNLEKLAGRGVLFSQAYAPHPNCSPSRYSIQTGKSPALLQMTDIVGRHTGNLYEGNRLTPPSHVNDIADEEVTIAEWIKQHRPEYSAAHFGKWHINGGGPKAHGYDASDGATGNRDGLVLDGANPKRIFSITESGNKWMEEQVKAKRPFFMQLSHYATHLAIFNLKSTLESCENREPGQRHNHAGHAAMSEDLDTGVGLTLAKIRELGIEDNTYVIYLADNGSYPLPNPGNTNGPLHGWKATLWEGVIRVPFIVAGPGIKPGRSRELVVGYDLFPTISEWLGIEKNPEGVEGGSLVKILSGDPHASIIRPNNFLVFHFPHYQLDKGSQPVTTLHQGNYKLIKFWETGDYRLYDLKKDLSESDDISKNQTNRTVKMSRLMNDYLASINAGIPSVNTQFDPLTDPGRENLVTKHRLLEEPYFIQ